MISNNKQHTHKWKGFASDGKGKVMLSCYCGAVRECFNDGYMEWKNKELRRGFLI